MDRARWRLQAGLGAALIALATPALAVVIPVICNGQQVGRITAETAGLPPITAGVHAEFTSTVGAPPTLAAAAAACGEDHFNWYQVVVADNNPPLDAGGKRVTPPYVDPPPGGYAADPMQNPPFPARPADALPWFWDEGTGSDIDVTNFTDASTLFFEDLPNGPAGTRLLFNTWLVSLNADGSLHSFHPGFTWDWLRKTDGSAEIVILTQTAFLPTPALYDTIIGGFDTRIPEPEALALLGLGAALLITQRRWRRSR